jgi:HSP20 family molecular chaperone IbpA
MYFSGINPNQSVAFSQGYQSGATAIPVSMRPTMFGNNVTYAFNPLWSHAAASLNPTMAQQTNFNNNLASQSFIPVNISAWQNPLWTNTALAFNPMLSGQTLSGSGNISGQTLINSIQSSSGMAQMRVDLSETNNDVVVAAELPNISLNDLNLTVTDDSLTISATAWSGNQTTSLFRTIALPTSIRSEQVEATYANGILEIRAPKSDVLSRRRVKINMA